LYTILPSTLRIAHAIYTHAHTHACTNRAQHFVQDDGESGSEISGRSGGSASGASIDWASKFSAVHDQLANVMFYV
jgi:hypothetical protein